jgi:hypothetical protein
VIEITQTVEQVRRDIASEPIDEAGRGPARKRLCVQKTA